MGGRGSSSSAASSRSAEAKARLSQIAENFAGARDVGGRDYAAAAQAASELAGAQRLRELLKSNDLYVLERELGNGSTTTLGKLDDLAASTNKPLGMAASSYSALADRLSRLHAKGFTNAEIAGAAKFGSLLRETL